jgi:quinol monooxygenase YgiN
MDRRVLVIFITAKFQVLPEHADDWPAITREFTTATRDEPGCLWFDWSGGAREPPGSVSGPGRTARSG